MNIKTGTTTLGILYKEGIVLAADKRVTGMGESVAFIVSKNIKKIIKISDYAAITTAGSVADVEQLAKVLSAQVNLYEARSGRRMEIFEMANLFSTINFQNRFGLIPSEFILGGFDHSPKLFLLETAGSYIEEDKYAFSGSGSLYAIGVIDAEYKRNMDKSEAISLAIKALNSAMQRDPYTGEGIDIAIIDKNGVKFLEQEEIQNYLKSKN
ncbi:MAG: proteasome subunit beta [Candidatus Rehaiarchaeum fermentans]|nr:proteasome subunit beta [Candidatus Rehaiarchaeum fermentans]